MAKQPTPEPPNDPLELATGATDDPLPRLERKPSPTAGNWGLPPVSERPAPEYVSTDFLAADERPSVLDRPPKYRCLDCGYILPPYPPWKCTECGRQFSTSVLDDWFRGIEGDRLAQVAWLLVAVLFVRVLPLIEFAVFARVAAAAGLIWAARIARRGKEGSLADSYAIAALVCAVLMLIPFAWISDARIIYYMLEMLCGALIVRSVTRDAQIGPIARSSSHGPITLVMILATPLIAWGLYIADRVTPMLDLPPTAMWGNGTWVAENFPPFSVILPAVISSLSLVYCWWAIWSTRWLIYRPIEIDKN